MIIPVNDEKFDKETLYTPEFLNSLTLPGLPPHSLQLEVNTPILQLPIQIAYAMTINKSQGQTLDHIGLYFHMDNYTLQFLELRQLLL
ncbi:hypothetical protein AXF42_Ash006617 [Apostasia shenzhenica]|uniref:DNA helicase n=1 Tax=Apostasia shenzhenica TaxID=1088818 RepID=A0A2I0AIR5_9ASPA|nr:hypothetical protein AXF42_Ash006617 [Apostasia shenzhenica]